MVGGSGARSSSRSLCSATDDAREHRRRGLSQERPAPLLQSFRAWLSTHPASGPSLPPCPQEAKKAQRIAKLEATAQSVERKYNSLQVGGRLGVRGPVVVGRAFIGRDGQQAPVPGR